MSVSPVLAPSLRGRQPGVQWTPTSLSAQLTEGVDFSFPRIILSSQHVHPARFSAASFRPRGM